MHYLYSVYFLKIRYDENNLDVYEWSIFKALSIANALLSLDFYSRCIK